MSAAQNIRRTVTISWPQTQERQARALLIRTARAGHQKIMAEARQGGAEPDWQAYANTPGNSRLESVRLPGPIVFNYFRHREVAIVALRMLREASPVQSGRYRNTHTLYVNGAPVDALPRDLKRGDSIYLANPLPYSRRLEIGKTESGRDFLISVPNRIYERVAKALRGRYGRSVKITFGYVTPPDAGRLQRNNPARSWLTNKRRWYYAPGQRADRAKGAAIRSPAIFIEMLT